MTVEVLWSDRQAGASPTVVDVRSGGEFAAGHIPGAVHIPLDEVEARLEDIPGAAPVVLVCQSGDRAKIVCELIREKRPHSTVLEGGTEAWELAGLPIVASTRTRWSLERQVRLTAGMIVLTGSALSVLLEPGWGYLAMFIGAGLVFAGLTNICGMAALFAQMPWNKPRRTPISEAAAKRA